MTKKTSEAVTEHILIDDFVCVIYWPIICNGTERAGGGMRFNFQVKEF